MSLFKNITRYTPHYSRDELCDDPNSICIILGSENSYKDCLVGASLPLIENCNLSCWDIFCGRDGYSEECAYIEDQIDKFWADGLTHCEAVDCITTTTTTTIDYTPHYSRDELCDDPDPNSFCFILSPEDHFEHCLIGDYLPLIEHCNLSCWDIFCGRDGYSGECAYIEGQIDKFWAEGLTHCEAVDCITTTTTTTSYDVFKCIDNPDEVDKCSRETTAVKCGTHQLHNGDPWTMLNCQGTCMSRNAFECMWYNDFICEEMWHDEENNPGLMTPELKWWCVTQTSTTTIEPPQEFRCVDNPHFAEACGGYDLSAWSCGLDVANQGDCGMITNCQATCFEKFNQYHWPEPYENCEQYRQKAVCGYHEDTIQNGHCRSLETQCGSK